MNNVTSLTEIDASVIALVGGKATGLGEMVAMGERVPPGFCLTTAAYTSGELPEAEIVDAYERMGGGRVAVRSSATAEDLPDASFAGQQDTVLNVEGTAELIAAVRRCWDSLYSERAVAYREANGIPHESVHMAVVVQRMVNAREAGVLFTANPLTGSRSEMVVDAAPGLGTAVVDGTVDADHYVLSRTGPIGQENGCLGPAQLDELREAGERLQEHFGSPQDVEFAFDGDGTLWLLQSRAVTTLFPLPDPTDQPQPRLYLEVGNIQGMLRPFTRMGVSAMMVMLAQWCRHYGIKIDPYSSSSPVVVIGGRLYMDLTDFMHSKLTRDDLPEVVAIYGARVRSAIEQMLNDPRFAPRRRLPFSPSSALKVTLRLASPMVVGMTHAIARPQVARAQAFRGVEEVRRASRGPAEPATAAERLRFVTETSAGMILSPGLLKTFGPTMAGILLSVVPSTLLKGIAAEGEVETTLGGMPHNVTTEMDLALWRLAENATEHRELLLTTPPEELAARYREGTLPDIGLAAFLEVYGHRAAGEVDIGVPRWGEDPSPLFATIANYLRLDDPEQAPERRFERAAAKAEAMIEELSRRARRRRPVRGRIASVLMRRSRELTGLRELIKFTWLIPYYEMRKQLLLVGEDLVARGQLERPDDIMFLDLREAHAAVHEGADHRKLVEERRAVHERELRRPSVPAAMLSDGTDVESNAPPSPVEEGALVGLGAAPGMATGRARVIRDPAGAHIEPGEILVAPTTDPGWTPLFMTAGGLVTETGSPIAHGPTVAREYGIPAVICVRDATRQIETGQLITIDGATGTVITEGETVEARV
ncbi:pyruvate, water dikinase [Nocardiopsis gilva YIM 90087]|uniref:Pyruvate, water dikinase n=1 Tax=Nocardiopsis gilva YIM 90087 TaxID=1235441 RepID=A0A223SAH0_9ACTN|nr:PEP/pyruvate-binding domain-containing protein [Nocardiopsis gilva]ASU85049.1 pyruvate, water dikinase [Nocardiopsis gilva YIM 90087]